MNTEWASRKSMIAREYLILICSLIIGVPFALFGPHFSYLLCRDFDWRAVRFILTSDGGWFAVLIPYIVVLVARSVVHSISMFSDRVHKRQWMLSTILACALLLVALVLSNMVYQKPAHSTSTERQHDEQQYSPSASPRRGEGLPRLPKR